MAQVSLVLEPAHPGAADLPLGSVEPMSGTMVALEEVV